MKTKFGNAKINKNCYYQITSRKEGNLGKYLHRLIWEDWYGKPVPEGYVIHHLNGDKLDNRIQNLQCVSNEAHLRFHNKGKKHSDETRKKISEANKGRTLSDETKKKMVLAKKGENHPQWKDYARVIKRGKTSNGKKRYSISYQGKDIKWSIDKEKLEELAKQINKGDEEKLEL